MTPQHRAATPSPLLGRVDIIKEGLQLHEGLVAPPLLRALLAGLQAQRLGVRAPGARSLEGCSYVALHLLVGGDVLGWLAGVDVSAFCEKQHLLDWQWVPPRRPYRIPLDDLQLWRGQQLVIFFKDALWQASSTHRTRHLCLRKPRERVLSVRGLKNELRDGELLMLGALTEGSTQPKLDAEVPLGEVDLAGGVGGLAVVKEELSKLEVGEGGSLTPRAVHRNDVRALGLVHACVARALLCTLFSLLHLAATHADGHEVIGLEEDGGAAAL
mmetsp:Transcript_2/g.5  ORF Transcript_2/g.5 Transcript_2/m.5 type:complete len:271 (-) Transcript_2:336-1148(-)